MRGRVETKNGTHINRKIVCVFSDLIYSQHSRAGRRLARVQLAYPRDFSPPPHNYTRGAAPREINIRDATGKLARGMKRANNFQAEAQ
jgi:hypothetical protein